MTLEVLKTKYVAEIHSRRPSYALLEEVIPVHTSRTALKQSLALFIGTKIMLLR
jgi:hypothetical protein